MNRLFRDEFPAMKKCLGALFGVLIFGLLYCYGQSLPLYFIMMADPQFGMYAADKSFAQETANYEFAIATANRLKPAFVIVLGDLANKAGDPAQIREVKRISHGMDRSIPLYYVAGNHDVGNEPTPQSLAAFRKKFGRDYYSFRTGPVYGIVLNSTLIHAPKNAMRDYLEQDAWLKKELEKARAAGAEQTLLFLHHPLFLRDSQEPDQYENIPLERRQPLLELFHRYGIRNIFSGHTHKNVLARDGDLEMVATGPVGKPLGQDGSGIRVAMVTANGVVHRYYDFGALPESLGDIQK